MYDTVRRIFDEHQIFNKNAEIEYIDSLVEQIVQINGRQGRDRNDGFIKIPADGISHLPQAALA